MDFIRIIPCLDVKNGRLVKGVHFNDLRDVADPAEMGAAYSKAGADEGCNRQEDFGQKSPHDRIVARNVSPRIVGVTSPFHQLLRPGRGAVVGVSVSHLMEK